MTRYCLATSLEWYRAAGRRGRRRHLPVPALLQRADIHTPIREDAPGVGVQEFVSMRCLQQTLVLGTAMNCLVVVLVH